MKPEREQTPTERERRNMLIALNRILHMHFGKIDGVLRGDLIAWREEDFNKPMHPEHVKWMKTKP